MEPTVIVAQLHDGSKRDARDAREIFGGERVVREIWRREKHEIQIFFKINIILF